MAPKSKQSSINININNDENPLETENINVENPYTQYKEYIIKNNIVLQNENTKSREKIKELESIILQQENEEDKYDNRIRYMKGLINNLNELKNLYNELSKDNESITIAYIDHETKIYKEAKIFYAKNFGLNLSFILWNMLLIFTSALLNNYYYFIGLVIDILIIIQIYFVYKYYYSLLINSNEKVNTISNNLKHKISSIKDEIKKLEDSTINLDNWICEI
jgi:hypothetical protein